MQVILWDWETLMRLKANSNNSATVTKKKYIYMNELRKWLICGYNWAHELWAPLHKNIKHKNSGNSNCNDDNNNVYT